MARTSETYEVRAFPKIRRAYTYVLREGQGRRIIHGLVEVDMTRARAAIRDQMAEGASRRAMTAPVETHSLAISGPRGGAVR